jgi:hypothetical protein
MAKSVENKKNEFGDLIKKLESHEFLYGCCIVDIGDIIYSIKHHFDCKENVVDFGLLEQFIRENKEDISYIVNKNIGYYTSDIIEGIDDDIWDAFGEEILKTCKKSTESD